MTRIGQIGGNLLKNQRTRRIGHHWALGQAAGYLTRGDILPIDAVRALHGLIHQGFSASRDQRCKKHPQGPWNWTWILREGKNIFQNLQYKDDLPGSYQSLVQPSCPEVNVTEFLSNIKPKARDEPSMGRCLLPTSEI